MSKVGRDQSHETIPRKDRREDTGRRFQAIGEPIIPFPEPQNKQHAAQPGSQGSQPAQAYQSPQDIQPQPQGFRAPPRPSKGPGVDERRMTLAVWVYEIAIGAVQTLISLMLILAGNRFVYFFGGGYGLLGGGGVIGLIIFTLIGFALVVADNFHPLKLLC